MIRDSFLQDIEALRALVRNRAVDAEEKKRRSQELNDKLAVVAREVQELNTLRFAEAKASSTPIRVIMPIGTPFKKKKSAGPKVPNNFHARQQRIYRALLEGRSPADV